jgi:hypothetical protein
MARVPAILAWKGSLPSTARLKTLTFWECSVELLAERSTGSALRPGALYRSALHKAIIFRSVVGVVGTFGLDPRLHETLFGVGALPRTESESRAE